MSLGWDSETNQNYSKKESNNSTKSGNNFAENFSHLSDNVKLNWNRKSVCVLICVKSGSGSSRQRAASSEWSTSAALGSGRFFKNIPPAAVLNTFLV